VTGLGACEGGCDREGTTEPLNGMTTLSSCTARGKTWPARFGAGAPNVRMVEKHSD
jgi:hypothetical protein